MDSYLKISSGCSCLDNLPQASLNQVMYAKQPKAVNKP